MADRQLNRFIETGQPAANARAYPLIAGFLLMGAAKSLSAADIATVTPVEIVANSGCTEDSSQPPELLADSLHNTIQGKVIDAGTQKPLQGAYVCIKNTGSPYIYTYTDFKGLFRLTIPDRLTAEKIILAVGKFNYQEIRMEIDLKKSMGKKDILITLRKENNPLLGKISAVKVK